MKQSNLIILDRDGVINFDSPDFIKTEAEWLPIPGSLEAIAQLNQSGYTVVVATNQSGIARGLFDIATLNRIHHKMQQTLTALGGNIHSIYFCPHTPQDNCLCRKPKPGLFHQIAEVFDIDFSKTTVMAVGDSLRDLEAAFDAGCQPILVLTGNGVKTLEKINKTETSLKHPQNIPIYKDLNTAVSALLGKTQ